MTQAQYDVAVVGGGVAGCSVAIQLALQRQRVLLCEAQTYPHHKVCGEFLSPECSAFLADLGVTSTIQAIKPAEIRTVSIIAQDETTWKSDLPGTGLGISRYALDDLLAKRARACGVDLLDQTTVTDITGNLDTTFKLTLRTSHSHDEIHAKTVIGAHGKRSRIDHRLSRPFIKNPQPFLGLKAHFYGPPLPGEIHLYAFPGGYCGLSEIENGRANVCLLVRQETFHSIQRQSASSTNHFLEWMKHQNPALGRWLSDATPVFESWLSIAQIPFVDKQVVVNDVLMTGDSAGLIAPVAGDGIGMAFQASYLLSNLVEQYLSGHISADLLRRHYATIWWQTFGIRLRLSRVLQNFMLHPGWFDSGITVGKRTPSFKSYVSDAYSR